MESAEEGSWCSFLGRRNTASLISGHANFCLYHIQPFIIKYNNTLNALIACIILASIVWNTLENTMNSYSDQGNRRPSTSTSIPSSKYTDNGVSLVLSGMLPILILITNVDGIIVYLLPATLPLRCCQPRRTRSNRTTLSRRLTVSTQTCRILLSPSCFRFVLRAPKLG